MCLTSVATGFVAHQPLRTGKTYLSPALCVTLGCADETMAAFVSHKKQNNMQYLSTSAFISYCQKIIFTFEWAMQGLFYYLKGSALIQSDRCWRKNREVMKDSLSMGIKTASWGFVSVSHACSVGLLCSLRRYTAPAYQAPLSFSLHTQMDLWGIQPKLWVGQIRAASLMLQLYFFFFWEGVLCCSSLTS